MFKINQFECSYIFNIFTLIFALEYTIIPVCLHIFKSDGIIRSHFSSSLDNACSFVLLFWGRAIGLSERVLQCSQAKKWFQAKLYYKWRKHEKSFNSLGTEKQNKTKKPCKPVLSVFLLIWNSKQHLCLVAVSIFLIQYTHCYTQAASVIFVGQTRVVLCLNFR